MRRIAQRLEFLAERREHRFSVPCFLAAGVAEAVRLAKHHRHPAGGKIDPGVIDPLGFGKLPFQKRDAGAAMDAGDDQVNLAQAIAERPARQPQLLG